MCVNLLRENLCGDQELRDRFECRFRQVVAELSQPVVHRMRLREAEEKKIHNELLFDKCINEFNEKAEKTGISGLETLQHTVEERFVHETKGNPDAWSELKTNLTKAIDTLRRFHKTKLEDLVCSHFLLSLKPV
ncbi:hypothetical protein EG68_09213 [Paragonimus skrjabini miyazakii]|uniref:Uncharacterized protein n=1 Tax=Paragonimus skrjabini miyazakii TaxID=59628 RepID=A0A8S9YL02_9TREM|nr:hypothetical protein EG68_09213 [Paragonimus skrjabini miyazakii]